MKLTQVQTLNIDKDIERTEASRKGQAVCIGLLAVTLLIVDTLILTFRVGIYGIPYSQLGWAIAFGLAAVCAVAVFVWQCVRSFCVQTVERNVLMFVLYSVALIVEIILAVVLGDVILSICTAVAFAVYSLLIAVGQVFYNRSNLSNVVRVVVTLTVLVLLCGAGFLSTLATGSAGGTTFVWADDSRNVQLSYQSETDSYTLERVMWTFSDLKSGNKTLALADENGNRVDGKKITKISAGAFNGIRTFSEVVLPASVENIAATAFDNSEVATLVLFSDTISFGDDLSNTRLEHIYLRVQDCQITMSQPICDAVRFVVDADRIDTYRMKYFSCQQLFIPHVDGEHIFVNFNISGLPDDLSHEMYEQLYIPTAILPKNSFTTWQFDVYDEFIEQATEFAGECWLIELEPIRYKMFGMSYYDENGVLCTLTPTDLHSIAVETSLELYGVWRKTFAVSASYSINGVSTTKQIGEVHEGLAALVLDDTELQSELVGYGYECRNWCMYLGDVGDDDNVAVVESIDAANLTGDVTVFPNLALGVPTVTASDDVNKIYNGQTVTLSASATLAGNSSRTSSNSILSDGPLNLQWEYKWRKTDSYTVLDGYSPTLKGNVADSGWYMVTVTVSDLEGRKSTNYAYCDVNITPKELKIKPNGASTVYGMPLSETLSYTTEGQIDSVEFSGALSWEQSIYVGQHAITIGTLAVVGEHSSNYTLVVAQAYVTVSPCDITITADNKTSVYGNSDQPLTVTSQFAYGDSYESGLYIEETDVRTDERYRDVGDYQIKLQQQGFKIVDKQGNNVTGNYHVLSFTEGSYTVSAKTVSVVWGELNFDWDGMEKCPIATVQTLQGTQTLIVSGGSAEEGSHQATAAFALDFAAQRNYQLENTTMTFTVTKSEAEQTAQVASQILLSQGKRVHWRFPCCFLSK